jgi:hypothetical protein
VASEKHLISMGAGRKNFAMLGLLASPTRASNRDG